MALGLNYGSDGGSFESKPYINYDSRAGRITAVDRVQGASGWESIKNDITGNFAMVFDMANIKVGWIHFSGQGPQMTVVPLGQPIPAKPSAEHKQGYVMSCYSKPLGPREFSSVAKAALAGMDALHSLYEAAPEAKQGLLPVVTLQTVKPIETEFTNKEGKKQKNTNYEPVWAIAQWVPRPAALTADTRPTASAAPPASAPATPRAATPVPPPPPVAAPAAAPATTLNADDFG